MRELYHLSLFGFMPGWFFFLLILLLFCYTVFNLSFFDKIHIIHYVVSSTLISILLINYLISSFYINHFFCIFRVTQFISFVGHVAIWLLLAVVVANLILNLIYSKISTQQYVVYGNIFLLVLFFFFFSLEKNLFLVFIYYELLLLPSYLLIFYLSPNKRFLIVSTYFLIWTQFGSFLVFLCISYLFFFYGLTLNTTSVVFSFFENNILFILIYVGFGIKIPIWPFFYWLTKTHVEAPSFFSIYLSGFLVKTALLGFYKFLKFFFITHIINYVFIFTIFSIIDSSLKLWLQVDLKKLVAFCTVQEMNLIFFLVFFNTSNVFIIIILFSLTHAILSSIFFYLVDVIYRLYATRLIFNVTGLLLYSPNLAIYIYLSIILYNGLPFTLKFLVELYVLQIVYDYNLFIYVNILWVCGWIGAVGLAKNWLNLMFSAPSSKTGFSDLTKKEIFFLNYCFLLLVGSTQLTFFLF